MVTVPVTSTLPVWMVLSLFSLMTGEMVWTAYCRPATRSDNFVQPIRIRQRIGVRCDAALGAVAACCRNKPLHVLRRKRLFKTLQGHRIVLRLFHNSPFEE